MALIDSSSEDDTAPPDGPANPATSNTTMTPKLSASPEPAPKSETSETKPAADATANQAASPDANKDNDHSDCNDGAESTSGDNSKKRASTSSASGGPAKVTKRRAARACVSCRARKVRCDVVEGAPCGNCRWDHIECVVQESRRRK